MPPLYHKLPNEEFDIMESECVEWLISQPAIREFVWNQFKQSGDIEYDSETGIWVGVDYE